MTRDKEITRLNSLLQSCQERMQFLEKENQLLKEKLDFLETFPTLVQGLKGEVLVAQLTAGTLTGYLAPHDVEVKTGDRLEVKNSKLHIPSKSKTKRWNWHNLLGRDDKGKQYEYLVLMGEKDPRYLEQYPPGLPYVFFLVPRSEVPDIKTPGKKSIAMNTNLGTATTPQAENLKSHLVVSEETFKALIKKVAILGDDEQT